MMQFRLLFFHFRAFNVNADIFRGFHPRALSRAHRRFARAE
jgi:hypothetical protein